MSGTPIPLASVATFEHADGQTLIKREGGRRCVTVSPDFAGRDQAGFVGRGESSSRRRSQAPGGLPLRWIGLFENLRGSPAAFSWRRFNRCDRVWVTCYYPGSPAAGASRAAARAICPGWRCDRPLRTRHDIERFELLCGFSTLFGVSMLNGILMVRAIDARWRIGPTLDDAILDGETAKPFSQS